MTIFRNIIDDNKFTPENVHRLETKLFFEGAKRRVALERYTVLLLLATFIATYGVIGDSAATVIGAMIIAPLMRPIMATTAALVMGNMKQAGISFLIVVASVAGAIGLALLLAEISVARAISIETNSQITGRVAPRLIDLWAALGAGAAGAFAFSRDDVADSLPGVAIAIALVPPLCVVGIGLAEGEIDVVLGAMLLFTTNFLAILLAGGGVLALLGLSAATMKNLEPHVRLRAFILIAIALLLVTVPLGATSIRIYNKNRLEREITQLAQEWTKGSGYRISEIEVDEDSVDLIINGSGERPLLTLLGNKLDASLDQPFVLRLVVLPSEREFYEDLSE